MWKNEEFLKGFFDSLQKNLGIVEDEDWYRVDKDDIYAKDGEELLTIYQSVCEVSFPVQNNNCWHWLPVIHPLDWSLGCFQMTFPMTFGGVSKIKGNFEKLIVFNTIADTSLIGLEINWDTKRWMIGIISLWKTYTNMEVVV